MKVQILHLEMEIYNFKKQGELWQMIILLTL
jgi:hypothetical protein